MVSGGCEVSSEWWMSACDFFLNWSVLCNSEYEYEYEYERESVCVCVYTRLKENFESLLCD